MEYFDIYSFFIGVSLISLQGLFSDKSFIEHAKKTPTNGSYFFILIIIGTMANIELSKENIISFISISLGLIMVLRILWIKHYM